MNIAEILERNEIAIDKWQNRPKFTNPMSLVSWLKFLHDTKRFFIIQEIKKHLSSTGKNRLRILDFGSGQGGITLDIKTYFGNYVEVVGYDVSPKACAIASGVATQLGSDVNFICDPDCNIEAAIKSKFDIVISCDVFGHVPSVLDTFKSLHKLILPGGGVIAFSESITGDSLFIPRYLKSQGFSVDDSEEEHISLHSVKELHSFLSSAGFMEIKIFPFDPIRFAFYPKRYLKSLRQCNKPLFATAVILSLFQNKLTEIAYNQINLFLARHMTTHDTAGCLIIAKSPS
jgi:2-polyprenyl-3-methyl-5-hydroxy-6-metoxy-1,4-benzoquinol methylase